MSNYPKPVFWISNISSRNVTLADLAINIKAFTTVNLLDTKHYKYTLDQLLKSEASGSIFKKRDKIVVRTLPPPTHKDSGLLIRREEIIPSKERSLFVIKHEEYDELKFDEVSQDKLNDEIYAQENADLADLDSKETIMSRKIT